MNPDLKKVSVSDFANHFGTSKNDFDDEIKKMINEIDFSYYELSESENLKTILEILKRIESDEQKIASKERENVWQKGWNENYTEFIKSNYNLDTLIPKFIRPNQLIRLNRRFIKPANNLFEFDFFRVFRYWLFSKYFSEFDSIYEFGCGTGMNLVELSKLYPEKKLYGSDFVKSSVNLVNEIAKAFDLNLKGFQFDMINPNFDFKIDSNSIFYTFGALEQLGSQTEKMLRYILKQKPKLIVHLEPTIELYDENNLIDYLAIKFHKKRGYTEGYLPMLKKLEKEGEIKIVKEKRLEFGSLLMEGFTYFIWKIS
tara:strand:+ start:148 stop:1086 length:939 start_codon:yes stop_codon:yes gene_type:complete